MPRTRSKKQLRAKSPKNSTLSTGKIVEVYWKDHAANATWMNLEDVKKWVEECKTKPCLSRGEIVYEDSEVIVMTDGNDGQGNFGNTSLIFKKLIVKRGAKK